MSVEENIKLVETAVITFNERKWDQTEFYAENVIYTHPQFPEPQKGVAILQSGGSVRQYYEILDTMAPDCRIEIEQKFGQDDWVFLKCNFTGTNTGPYPYVEDSTPTNKPFRLPVFIASRVQSGKIAEMHHYTDRLTIRSQVEKI